MKTMPVAEILKMPWARQADHLRGLSRKELEVLWFQVQRHGESFDKLKLAVFSILRDLYEAKEQAGASPERSLQRGCFRE